MIRALRPVGEPIPRPSRSRAWAVPPGFDRSWYGSGTSAIAAVLSHIVTRAETSTPEVLLPAYTCPDVLSAIVYAKARPVLVDLQAQRPWMAIEALEAALTADSVAIIGVDFQGIPERIERLREVADRASVPLVYDHCQGFPPEDNVMSQSDFLIFSFGRGKPASALVGGAAVINRERQATAELEQARSIRGAPSATKRLAYNSMIKPHAYWLVTAMPFLGIGETVYRPLDVIEGLDGKGVACVEGAVAAHMQARTADTLDQYRRHIPSSVDLPLLSGVEIGTRLLRLALLMPSRAAKQSTLTALTAAGLGASPLYPVALCDLPGVPSSLGKSECTNARDFAARLMTLPIHSAVRLEDVQEIGRLVQGAL